MPSADTCLANIDSIDGWDFDPPDWWVDAWYEAMCEVAPGDHVQVDPKVEELLSQQMPF